MLDSLDKIFIAAFIFGSTTFMTFLNLAIYWAIKTELDEIWKDTDKIKKRVKHGND